MTFSSIEEFERFLIGRIPRGPRYGSADARGVERTRALLARLGDPQQLPRVIHIAGTSGKGSTGYLVSALLRALRQPVGLHVSPHITDLRERFQVDDALLPWNEVLEAANDVLPAVHAIEAGTLGRPTYFETLLALAFHVFRRRNVHYAVIETGIGGRYDGTNLLYRRDSIVLLTRIGRDHTDILGNRIAEIAWHKAGIIQPGNTVLSSRQLRRARTVIEQAASAPAASLAYLQSGVDFGAVRAELGKTWFSYFRDGLALSHLELGLTGAYQAENASLALAAVQAAFASDCLTLAEPAIRAALSSVRIPVRAELFRLPGNGSDQLVILDGAHNPQKMRAFIGTLRRIDRIQRYDFLVAFQQGKEYREMLRILLPLAHSVTITSFYDESQDARHLSENPAQIGDALDGLGFTNYNLVDNAQTALHRALARTEEDAVPLIVTGSLYLCGLLRQSLGELAES